MSEPNLVEEIRDIIALTEPDAFEPGTPPYLLVTSWLKEIAEAADAIARKLHARALGELVAPATEAALLAFDELMVPIDLPMNNILERMVESQVRAAIPGVVAAAFAYAQENAP
jgi:hypothetical protein